MIIGDPYVFGIMFDRIKEWNSTKEGNNGFFALSVYGEMFPNRVNNVVVDTNLYDVLNSLKNIPVDKEIYFMEKEKALIRLCDLVYPSDYDRDNDYRYELAPSALTDEGCYVFVLSNKDKIRIIAAELNYDIEESTLIFEGAKIQEVFLDETELVKITKEIKLVLNEFNN